MGKKNTRSKTKTNNSQNNQKQIEEHQRYINQLRSELSSLETKINNYWADVRDKSAKIDQLRAASRRLGQLKGNAESARDLTNRKKNSLNSTSAWKGQTKKFTVGLYNNLYNDWNTYINNIETAKVTIDSRIRTMEDEVGRINSIIGSLANSIASIKSKL